jgi:hypothetical protein
MEKFIIPTGIAALFVAEASLKLIGVTSGCIRMRGLRNKVLRLPYAAVASVECMEPEVARQPASVTENIGMACERRRRPKQ